MDSRRWWLLAAAVPVAFGCALATAQPVALALAGQFAVIGAGLLAAAMLWLNAARTTRPRAWRMLATAPLLPVLGVTLTLVAGPLDPAAVAVLRWAPTVPGYLVAIIAILDLVDRHRLRAGRRVAVEVALFLVACLVVVGILLGGPDAGRAPFGLSERLVLGSAVLVTSAIMAAALTLLGVIEAGRRSMAVVLLAGTVLLTVGRGLATSALLAGTPVPAGVARILIAAGLLLLALAVLVDSAPGSAGDAEGHGEQRRRGVVVESLLPQLALLVAMVTVGTVALAGSRPNPATIGGLVLCVVLVAVHRGLTARQEQLLYARLRRSEAYFRSVVRSAGDAVVILDDDLRITWAAPALDRVLGQAARTLVGRPVLEVVHPADVAALAEVLPVSGSAPAAALAGGGLLTLRLQDAEGVWRYLEAGISDLRRDADVGAVVLHCRDMTDRHAREQALQAIAYTDPMTGLPNRAGVLQILQEAVSAPSAPPATLLIIELDGLATVRESAGREVVTAVVAEVGRRLRATVRGVDVVARMGGGAFAVLTHGDDADADRLAARCLSVVEQPLVTPSGTIELTAGLGLAPLEDGVGVDVLLARADLAVRAAHAVGPGSAARYQPSLGDAAARRDRLRADLRGAGKRGELVLQFQPVVSLDEQRITAVEALLGWRHPSLGEIAPAEFLPIAERGGLVGELQRWALDAAAAAAVSMPSEAGPVRIALHVPTAYVETGALVGDVEAVLTRSGLAPERLMLEISAATVESDDERIGFDISSLRLMGVHVALADFGAGSSALAHLTRLPIDVVKLDRALISRLDRDPQMRALCGSVVGIGRSLGMTVIADGVETPAQLAALCGFGCDAAQGFLLSRPTTLAGFIGMLDGDAGLPLPGLVSRP